MICERSQSRCVINRSAATDRDYPPGVGDAAGAGALCNCCAGCGEAPAPCASAFGGLGAPGGRIVPGGAPLIGSPGGRCAGAGGVACVPASSARSFSHAWESGGVSTTNVPFI